MGSEPKGDCWGALVTRLDVPGRLIRIVGTGCWSPSLMERHLEELDAAIARVRAGGGGVRVLSDLSQAAVQSPEVAARIERFTADAYGPDDRVAMVVASSLLKMQMRRVVLRARFETFLSLSAAETWLTAYDEAPRAAPAAAGALVARAPRHTTSITTTMRTAAGWSCAVVRNISATGLLLDSRGPLAVGEEVALTLPVVGVVAGRVVRVRGALAGVRFGAAIAVDRLLAA